MAHVLHNGPVYLAAPHSLEAPKALDLESLLAVAPFSISS